MTQTFLLLVFSVSFWNSNHTGIRIANIFLQLEFVLLLSAPPLFHLLFALVWIMGDFKVTTLFACNKLPNTTFWRNSCILYCFISCIPIWSTFDSFLTFAVVIRMISSVTYLSQQGLCIYQLCMVKTVKWPLRWPSLCDVSAFDPCVYWADCVTVCILICQILFPKAGF